MLAVIRIIKRYIMFFNTQDIFERLYCKLGKHAYDCSHISNQTVVSVEGKEGEFGRLMFTSPTFVIGFNIFIQNPTKLKEMAEWVVRHYYSYLDDLREERYLDFI